MENKELEENFPVKLDDGALDDVSGGVVTVPMAHRCKFCGAITMHEYDYYDEETMQRKISPLCNDCHAKMTAES